MKKYGLYVLVLLLCALFFLASLCGKTDAKQGDFLHISKAVTRHLLQHENARAVFGIEQTEDVFL